MHAPLKVQGRWRVQCFASREAFRRYETYLKNSPDPDKVRAYAGRDLVVWEEEFLNAVNTAALNDMLSVYFASGTQKTTWYFGLVNNSGFSAFAAGDTASSHAGWTESTDYSESTRQAWSPGAPSGGSIINSTPTTVTANTTVTIKGAFLISNATKGGSTGTLWATGAFGSNQALTNGQVLSLQYQCPLTAT